jgi:hypothetical protein
MKTIQQEYNLFLDTNFTGLKIKVPLFYNWQYGLRFELGTDYKEDSKEYFERLIDRATTLFSSAFESHDIIYMVLIEYKYKRSRIDHYNYIFRQIKDLKKEDISYSKVRKLYSNDNKNNVFNKAVVKLKTHQLNYHNILTAKAYNDFPVGLPWSRKEIHFINIDKNLIFNMYDDRGLDIIAADKEILRPLYNDYNYWILNYDKKKIDSLFTESNL